MARKRKSGRVGRASRRRRVRSFSYRAARASTVVSAFQRFQGRKRLKKGPVRMSFFVNSRSGASTLACQSLAAMGVFAWTGTRVRPVARAAAVMLPPETLATVRKSGRLRMPSSFSRRSAPRWKRVARNPPPERHRPMPWRAAFGRGAYLVSFALERTTSPRGGLTGPGAGVWRRRVGHASAATATLRSILGDARLKER